MSDNPGTLNDAFDQLLEMLAASEESGAVPPATEVGFEELNPPIVEEDSNG